MSGVKHTPWERLVGYAEPGHPIYKPGTEVILIVEKRAPGQTEFVKVALVDSGQANARLIAAAPDLLEALIEARLTLSLTRTNIMVEVKKSEGAAYRWEGVPELLANRIAQCDATIARARGEQSPIQSEKEVGNG